MLAQFDEVPLDFFYPDQWVVVSTKCMRKEDMLILKASPVLCAARYACLRVAHPLVFFGSRVSSGQWSQLRHSTFNFILRCFCNPQSCTVVDSIFVDRIGCVNVPLTMMLETSQCPSLQHQRLHLW